MLGTSLLLPKREMPSVYGSSSEGMTRTLHSLGNKLLPILVFSELALQKCEDEHIRKQLEKIHHSAVEARDLITQLRSDSPPGFQA